VFTPQRAVLVLLSLILSLGACGRTPAPGPAVVEVPSSDLIRAQPWSAADALFRTNRKWLGADGAYSIDLGDGRVLWLFGDTFISTSFLNTRRIAKMVRNSVGIQSGYDPSAASMVFTWRKEGGQPAHGSQSALSLSNGTAQVDHTAAP
jgi:hypothetical protein